MEIYESAYEHVHNHMETLDDKNISPRPGINEDKGFPVDDKNISPRLGINEKQRLLCFYRVK